MSAALLDDAGLDDSGQEVSRTRLLAMVRVMLLLFCAAELLVSAGRSRQWLGLIGLVAVAVGASVPLRNSRLAVAQPIVEAVLAALVISVSSPMPSSALVPYLIGPCLNAGLVCGAVPGIVTAGLSAVVTAGVLAYRARPVGSHFIDEMERWSLALLAVALLAAWIRRERRSAALTVATTEENLSYEAAYRLLTQLRLVSRQLSRGLDVTTLAQSLLQTLRSLLGYSRGGLYVRSAGGVLLPLAFEGTQRPTWDVSVSEGTLVGDAWASQQPQLRSVGLDGRADAYSAALPLRVGLRSSGVVLMERSQGPFESTAVRQAMAVAEEGALRLETALLFDEVRSLATAEERRRVAREIHDGIAQELASIGYVLDDIGSRVDGEAEIAADITALRTEITRLVTELRLSIFDLRSEIEPSLGLGATLSDYLRRVATSSGLTVHLVLDESPVRLPADAEAELLRIAQEAITNVRKHARASKVEVTCLVHPPDALLRVEDDGRGLGAARADSFGLEIMRERAARIGATLEVEDRPEGGASVQVRLGNVGNLIALRAFS